MFLRTQFKTVFQLAFFGLLFLFIMLQIFPYGRNHENPAIIAEPKWDTPQTRVIFFRACGNCHSNETHYPWYSNVAPVSWIVQHDVETARKMFNVSEWGARTNKALNAVDEITKGEMPLSSYLNFHPEAKLTAHEKEILIQGLNITFDKKE